MSRTVDPTTQLSYIHAGPESNNSAILYIHGWCCQASDFELLLEELSTRDPNLRAIAVDLPGHGHSSTKVCSEPTILSFALLVLDLAKNLGLRDVVLVGHSMGCRVVLEAFKQSLGLKESVPNVRGVVFLDGSHYKLRPKPFDFDSANPQQAPMTDEQKAAKKEELFEQMFSANTRPAFKKSCLAHFKAVDRSYSDAIRKSHISYDKEEMDTVLELLGQSKTDFLNLQSTDVDARNQRIPLSQGERSRFMEFLQQEIPQASQRVIERAGHFPHVDQPQAVADELSMCCERSLAGGR